MKIASWNINSIKARLPLVLEWLEENRPDILFLQELKGTDFPTDSFKKAGYISEFATQKTYNGVATLSLHPMETVSKKLPGDENDDQARYLETRLETKTGNIHLINIYAPNGNPVDSDKFTYKLQWLDRLEKHAKALRNSKTPFIIGGDFNVIPEEKDCHDPKKWINDALYRIETRQKFRSLTNLGLYDAFRIYNNEKDQYTFWDYRSSDWQNDKGLRIDHFLTSPEITDRVTNCYIDKAPRNREKPSDHTPIILEIS